MYMNANKMSECMKESTKKAYFTKNNIFKSLLRTLDKKTQLLHLVHSLSYYPAIQQYMAAYENNTEITSTIEGPSVPPDVRPVCWGAHQTLKYISYGRR